MPRKRSVFRPSHHIVLAAMAVTAAILASFAYDQWTNYRAALDRAERDTRNATALIAEHTARSFEAVEEVLRAVARVRRDVETGAIPRDPALIHKLLKTIHGTSPLYFGVGWVDADGNIAATSRFPVAPRANIAGQEHFRLQRDGTADELHISKTVLSVIDGQLLINASIRLTNDDGSFAGVAAVSLNPAYLAEVYGKIDLGPSQVMAVFRADGAYLVRSPNRLEWIEQDYSGRPLFRDHLPNADSGTFHATAPLDGVERIVSYARVPGRPLVVAATLSRDDALAAFRSHLATTGIRVGATIAVLALGAWFIVVQMRRRERAQADLAASETKLRDFAASSGDWFWETDAEHRFVWMSDSVEAATGVPAAWHYGKSRMDVAAPGVPPEVWEAHRQALREHRPFRDFEYLRRGPGGDRWLRSSGVPLFDANGGFSGYRGSGRDVTELRRAEQRLRDAVEAIPGRFMLFDADDRLVYANRYNQPSPAGAALACVGETFESILRQTVDAGFIPEAAADPEVWIAERLDHHRAAAGSTLLRRGSRVYEVIERPTHDGGIMLLRFDVTERERAAETERAAREAADAANRAKSEFLSRMSHELRTPLNAIIGFAQLLQLDRHRNLTDDQRQYGEFILNGGQHLLNLVNEVLDLSGIESGRVRFLPERVAIAEAVAEAVETVRPVAAKAGIELAPADAAVLPAVRADAQRLRQVLLNLLSNAIKYNRPRGAVRVSAETAGEGWVRIAVADTGFGIAPEDEKHLFEPFNRLGAENTTVEGTGIGLALSKRLIEAMDGRVGYTTRLGKGSTFWIELPADAGGGVRDEPPGPKGAAPAAAAGGYSLLYVEDNPANLRLMEHLVSTLPDVAMLAAPSGPLGLELAQAHRPDVIVLDLNLPGMSGFDVLARLEAMPETRDIPVLALTAAVMPHDIKRGLAAGFFRYITKPLDVNGFLAAVDAALAEVRTRRAAKADAPRRPGAAVAG